MAAAATSSSSTQILVNTTKNPDRDQTKQQQQQQDKQAKQLIISSEETHLQLLLSLPKARGLGNVDFLYNFQGFWTSCRRIEAVQANQENFKASDRDLIIATIPRSGTLWLKSMAFAVVNRTHYHVYSPVHPLLTVQPHVLVPFCEYSLYGPDADLDLTDFDSPPKLLATHIPYASLPESIKTTKSRIVYVCRNPRDNFISVWHFINKLRSNKCRQPLPLEEALDMYCNGVSVFGPFWSHILGYWKASLENPQKVLFLKYEDLKEDTEAMLVKVAEFLGFPFSDDEKSQGMVEGILKLSSFEQLKNLDVNMNGMFAAMNFPNKTFFRKGEVGDWMEYLTPTMVQRLDRVVEEEFHGSGLSFKY